MSTTPIKISVLANASQAKTEINEVGETAEKSTHRAASALKGLAAGFVAFEAFDKVKEVLKSSIEQARDAQKTNAQTAAVIKSTGGTARVSAEHVKEYADSLGRMSGQNADSIQSGENLLLTFQNVRNEVGKGNDVFDRASKTALNMATALGTAPKAAAKTLGKALNDPVKGLTALTRVGVTFNAQQTDQIKKMAASGHVLGAQKIILGQLDQKFDGSAKAQSTAGSRLKETFRQIEVEIGEKLLPILDKVENYVAEKLPQWMALGEAGVDKVKGAFEGVEPTIEKVIGFFKANPDTVKTFGLVLGALVAPIVLVTTATAALDAVLAVNPFVLLAVAIAAVAAALVYAYEHSAKFKAIVDATFGAVRAVVTKVIPAIIGFIKDHWATIAILLGGPVGVAAVIIAKNFSKIVTAIHIVGAAGKWLWNNVFQPVLHFIIEAIAKVLGVFSSLAHSFSWLPVVGGKFKAFGDALDKVIDKANGVADALHRIPKNTDANINIIYHHIGRPGPINPDLGSAAGGGASSGASARRLVSSNRGVTVNRIYNITAPPPLIAGSDYDAGEQIVAKIREFENAGGVQ